MNKAIKTNVWVCGVSGRTGRHIPEAIKKQNLNFVGGNGRNFEEGQYKGRPVTTQLLCDELQGADVVIDFSTTEANQVLLESMIKGDFKNKSVLIATTTITNEQQQKWKFLAKQNQLKILQAQNTSLGVLAMINICKKYAKIFIQNSFDIDIIEWHHRNKKDAPGGTTKKIIESLQMDNDKNMQLHVIEHVDGARKPNTIIVQVLRSGNVFGEHTVYFTSENEQVTISHKAFDRTLFADGAVKMSHWLQNQPSGYYVLDDLKLEELCK